MQQLCLKLLVNVDTYYLSHVTVLLCKGLFIAEILEKIVIMQLQLVGEDKKLGYDPTAIEFFNYGQFLIMCGSNHQVTLYSREGLYKAKLKPQ